jgi:hypothetical protein
MGTVLGWPPVVWALRIALFVVLVGCSYVYLLLITPFFRPANIRRMVLADLPRVDRLGAEVAGTRGEVQFVQDQRTQEANKENMKGLAGPADRVLRGGSDDGTQRSREDQL